MDEILQMIRGFFNMKTGSARKRTIRKRVLEDAKIDGIHVCQLIAAMLIACIGLNLDSTEAIIGAMLICPIMGSVLAISYGVASLDRLLLREGSLGLLVQILVCIVTSTIYFLISPLSGTTSELLTNSSATIWDLIIALVGGFAGAIGLSRREEPATLIAGVAVATALMPPLCSVGYGLSLRDLPLAASALYEFLINVVFIAFGAEIVMVSLRVPIERDLNGDGVVTDEEAIEAERYAQHLRRNLVIGSLLFAIPCLFITSNVVQRNLQDNGTVFEVRDVYDAEMTTRELRVMCPELVSYRIGPVCSYDLQTEKLTEQVIATVETTKELDAVQKTEVEAMIRLHVADLFAVSYELSEK